ncbi:hypothetical protein AX15_000713, partial [Amanita polypyramis BW_CC]
NHPHVTLRTRTRSTLVEGTSRCARYTTLTCLICEVLVYRVYQVVPVVIEGKEGPLLPTEEWVENEIMKSSSGWIEVSSQCLTDSAVQALESGSDYSPLFSVVLPKLPPPSPTFQVMHDPAVVSAVRSPSPQLPVSYLEKMKPLFPPSPFTPSHLVFQHLASAATARSELLRAQAEEYIARTIREKIAEVERTEEDLKEQVDALWLKFKTTVDKIKKEKEKPKASFTARTNHETTADTSRGTPVAVKEFVPVPVSSARSLSPSELPRVSALSASLATSSFRHPRAISELHTSPQEVNRSIHSKSSNSSERSGSATLVRSPLHEGGTNVLQFPRNIDDNLNTAVSFKYFIDLEQEIKRRKKEHLEEANRSYQVTQSEAGTSDAPGSPAVNGKEQEKLQRDDEAQGEHVQVDTEGSVVEKPLVKGKRHVTFDVEPDVVTIDEEARVGPKNESEQDSQVDMIFELEEPEVENSESSKEPMMNGRRQTLPLLEQPAARPSRHRKVKSLSSAGLPSSLSSLRPLSLPTPSQIRPPRSPRGIDSSFQNVMMSLPKQSALDQQKRLLSSKHTLADVPEEELDPRDAVILRLVAADAPSHRGAWRSDSEAWKSLTQSLGTKGRSGADVLEDEHNVNGDSLVQGPREPSNSESMIHLPDENESRPGIPGSLPIPIAPITTQKSPLNLASYRPKTSFTNRPGSTVPALVPKHPSAAALRRASYAERDRQRSMDPGALDFATEGDEENESSDDEVETGDGAGTRSRRRALKILQKRSEIPEEGMWRSLAT